MTREEILLPHLAEEMKQHALDDFPNEALGVILKNKTYKRLKNMAGKFASEIGIVNQRDWNKIMVDENLLAFFHSHPNHPFAPSAADMKAQQNVSVPFLMCATDGQSCTSICAWGDQLDPPPLYGRTFHHGITDCYEFIRDWFWLNSNLRLPQFARDWNWWGMGLDLYADGFPEANFFEIPGEQAHRGDVVLFKVRSEVYNHGGVIDSDGILGHHASSYKYFDPTKLSKRDPLSRWVNLNPMFLRYEDN